MDRSANRERKRERERDLEIVSIREKKHRQRCAGMQRQRNVSIFKNDLIIFGTIRKDCFQVKSNLLTNFRFTTHMNIMILN